MIVLLTACSVGATPPAPVPAPPESVVEPEPPKLASLPSGSFDRQVAPGLRVAAYDPPTIEDLGFSKPDLEKLKGTDKRLFVVTIDPAHYELAYLSTLDQAVGGPSRDATSWVDEHDLHVAFNPGMFEPDGKATGYTRSGSFVSQPQVRRQGLYRSWFVVGPSGVATLDHTPPKASGNYVDFETLPADFRAKLKDLTLVSQSLAVMRGGRAAYPARKNQWSELAYGTDREGRVVVVFSRWPYEMRELGKRLEALDIGIDALIHGEGGPEASLVVRAGGVELVVMGSYETGFFDDGNHHLWSLPAVLGAKPR